MFVLFITQPCNYKITNRKIKYKNKNIKINTKKTILAFRHYNKYLHANTNKPISKSIIKSVH